jgi:hypothetical protein
MSFDKPSMRARHERVHTGERPFKVNHSQWWFDFASQTILIERPIWLNAIKSVPRYCIKYRLMFLFEHFVFSIIWTFILIFNLVIVPLLFLSVINAIGVSVRRTRCYVTRKPSTSVRSRTLARFALTLPAKRVTSGLTSADFIFQFANQTMCTVAMTAAPSFVQFRLLLLTWPNSMAIPAWW